MSTYQDQQTSTCTKEVTAQLFQAVVQNDFSKLIELILSSHCDPRYICNDHKETLLHVACRLGHLDIVRILVEVYECSVSKCDSNNYTPPDYACLYGHLHLISYFKDCDIKLVCCSGKLPPIRFACAASQFGSTVLRLKPILFSDAYYIICKHLGIEPLQLYYHSDVPAYVYREACYVGNLDMARLALDELTNGIFIHVDILPHAREIISLLNHEACRLGHNDLMNYLINIKGHSILGLTGTFKPVLHYYYQQETEVEFRTMTNIEFGFEAKRAENHFTSRLCPGTFLIHSIIHCGNFEVVKQLLLACQYDGHSLVDKSGNTLLHSACVSARLDVVQVLVEDMNYDVNCRNKMGNTPLHVSIEWGSIEIAEYLLKKGCIVNQANELGQTPLYLSVLHERKSVFNSLLCMNVDINVTTVDSKESPLHVACCCGSADLAMLLLKRDQQSCHNLVDAYGETPLFNACRVENVNTELIGLMIRKGCNSRFVNASTNEIPIHIACRRGRTDIMKILLNDGVQGPVNQCNYVGMSLLHLACYNDDTEMVEFLLSNSICEVNSLDILGFAPLHIAATRNMISIAKLLLKSPYHSNISIEDNDGNVPLHHLCKREVVAIDLIQELTSDATVIHQNQKRYNPLHFTFEKSYSTLPVQCILNHPKLTFEDKERAIFATNLKGNTPLHLACKRGKLAPVNVLLDFLRCTSEIVTSALLGKNHDGDTPLHLACAKNQIQIIDCILGSNVLSEECILEAVTQQNKAGLNISHVSCNKDDSDVLKCVLMHLKDDIIKSSMVSLSQNDGMSPLHLACQRNSVTIIQFILDLDIRQDVIQSIFDVLTTKGDSMLHVAVRSSNPVSICKLLIQHQLCNVMHQNNDGDTALHITCRDKCRDDNCKELILLLCESKSNPHCLNNRGESPVSLAVQGLSKQHSSFLEEMVKKKYCNWNDLVEKRECCEPDKQFDYVYLDKSSYCYVEASCHVQLSMLHSIVNSCCVDSSHIGKFMDLTVEALTNRQVSPNIRDSFGNTVLHIYASIGQYFDQHYRYQTSQVDNDLLSYILDLSDCDVNIQNKDGNTPLHIACLLNNVGIARKLMQSEKADKSLGLQNNNDHLPIHCASSMEVLNCLIAHGASIDDIPESQFSKHIKERYSQLKSGYPLDPPITVLVIGNSSAGKTTLIRSLKSNLEVKVTEIVDVGPKPTAGVVRYEITSKDFGKIIFYDFAGQPEYETAHSALLQSILKSSTSKESLPILFFLVIDVTSLNMLKHLNYWLSFIQNCPITTYRAHIVVVGSHVDCISNSDVSTKVVMISAEIKAYVKQHSMAMCLIGTPVLVNCCNIGDEESKELTGLFTKSKDELKKCAEIDHRCYALYDFLLTKFRESPVKLADLESNLKERRYHYNGIEIPTTRGILLKLLETMHSRQYLLLFKKGAQDSSEYWIMTVATQTMMYSRVNGVLFAPECIEIKKRIIAKSNVGVLPSSALTETFTDIDIEVLQRFLTYNEFCQKIEDDITLQMIEGSEVVEPPEIENANHEIPSEVLPTADSSYFFFPGLVKAEKPKDIMKDSSKYVYTSGWCLECPVGRYFTIQFLHVVLLRCTFSFATMAEHSQGSFHRKCSIWENGIFWATLEGAVALVEVIEQNTIVLVLIGCRKGCEMSAIKLRADVIHEVLAVQAKYCPDLRVGEYVINPSSLSVSEESQLVNMLHQDKIRITEIANCISNGYMYVQDEKCCQAPLHINEDLLHFEPYAGIGQKLLASLFDPDKANEKVQKDILFDYASLAYDAGATPSHIGHMMGITSREIQQVQTSESEQLFRLFNGVSNYRHLHELFDSYSIFHGRNPLHLCKKYRRST